MTEERTTPLRERMIEDMRIHGMGDKAQKAHIRAVKDFALFLGRSPARVFESEALTRKVRPPAIRGPPVNRVPLGPVTARLQRKDTVQMDLEIARHARSDRAVRRCSIPRRIRPREVR